MTTALKDLQLLAHFVVEAFRLEGYDNAKHFYRNASLQDVVEAFRLEGYDNFNLNMSNIHCRRL